MVSLSTAIILNENIPKFDTLIPGLGKYVFQALRFLSGIMAKTWQQISLNEKGATVLKL